MFSYKLAKGTPLLEASWWKKRHGRSRSGLCKWSIKRAWNANKWTMAKCNIYTSFFSMLHTSFEVVVSLKVIFYPNGFLEKKNYAKTRPGSDFSTMSYRKGERNAMWFGAKQNATANIFRAMNFWIFIYEKFKLNFFQIFHDFETDL